MALFVTCGKGPNVRAIVFETSIKGTGREVRGTLTLRSILCTICLIQHYSLIHQHIGSGAYNYHDADHHPRTGGRGSVPR